MPPRPLAVPATRPVKAGAEGDIRRSAGRAPTKAANGAEGFETLMRCGKKAWDIGAIQEAQDWYERA